MIHLYLSFRSEQSRSLQNQSVGQCRASCAKSSPRLTVIICEPIKRVSKCLDNLRKLLTYPLFG